MGKLFDSEVSFLLKNANCEDRKAILHVCVEVHPSLNAETRKELIVQITHKTNLFFLYTLNLGEEDFQILKQNQGLLVDFVAFPRKFIDLLQLCRTEEGKAVPKFLLTLNSQPGSSSCPDPSLPGPYCPKAQLSVVETNPFKLLTHLTLSLTAGSDADVKTWLADNLCSLQKEYSLLQDRAAHTNTDIQTKLDEALQHLNLRTLELEQANLTLASLKSTLAAKHAAELAEVKQKALQSFEQLQEKSDAARKEASTEHTRTTKQFDERIAHLEGVNRELTETRFRAESSVRELSTRLAATEAELERYTKEFTSLRQQNANQDGKLHEREKELHGLKTKVAVLEQEVRDKEMSFSRTNDTLQREQEERKRLEEDLRGRQERVTQLETSVQSLTQEITKGNEIIRKLQTEVRGYHTKGKLRMQIAGEQEKLLKTKEQDLVKINADLVEANGKLKQNEEEMKSLTETLEKTMLKLEESRQLLKTNENVIQWLNKQLNETHSNDSRQPGCLLDFSSTTNGGNSRVSSSNITANSTYKSVTNNVHSTHGQTSPTSGASNMRNGVVQYRPAINGSHVSGSSCSVSGTVIAGKEEGKPPYLESSSSGSKIGGLDMKYLVGSLREFPRSSLTDSKVGYNSDDMHSQSRIDPGGVTGTDSYKRLVPQTGLTSAYFPKH